MVFVLRDPGQTPSWQTPLLPTMAFTGTPSTLFFQGRCFWHLVAQGAMMPLKGIPGGGTGYLTSAKCRMDLGTGKPLWESLPGPWWFWAGRQRLGDLLRRLMMNNWLYIRRYRDLIDQLENHNSLRTMGPCIGFTYSNQKTCSFIREPEDFWKPFISCKTPPSVSGSLFSV